MSSGQSNAEKFLNGLYQYHATELGGAKYRHSTQLLADLLKSSTLTSAMIKYNNGIREIILIYEFPDKSSLEIERRPMTGGLINTENINIFRVLI